VGEAGRPRSCGWFGDPRSWGGNEPETSRRTVRSAVELRWEPAQGGATTVNDLGKGLVAEALGRFNALSPAAAEQQLLVCCASSAWARAVAGGRPYRSGAALSAASATVLARLSWSDIAEALAAHPRIGQPPGGTGRDAAWSRREQAGVDDADAAVRAALAEANRDYERRFGRVFLIFASGRTPVELLAAARDRLAGDEATEREVVRAELIKITQLRLERLLSEGTS
jgi:2-oxo-4-hydroxy-4-carboxy-5-ureidoimidazoline decarboxylase